MSKKKLSRREFLSTASAGTVAAVASGGIPLYGKTTGEAGNLAILGGEPVRKKPFPSWPQMNESIAKSLDASLRTRKWGRFGGKMVTTFERKFAELMGAKRCVATGSGTQALHSALYAVGVGAGDEVLVTPCTFASSVDAIFLLNALPVFVDIDIETFQMDPDKMEEKINGNTKAVEPVHICGLAADMDRINAVAKKHNLAVVEDACQAHLTEYRGKLCGTMSDIGCFSFQSSKILPCGEGGAAIGDDENLMEKLFIFHTLGENRKSKKRTREWVTMGPKYRMNEFEAAVLLPQMATLRERFNLRNENAEYLSSRLKEIPGIFPQKHYDGAGKSSYYHYALRYKKEYFNNISRDKFSAALRAERIPNSSVTYSYELNKEPFIEHTLNTRTFKKLYSKERLKRYREENECPQNAKHCEEGMWISHPVLLGTKKDIDDIADAVRKIYENRNKLT
ncbi:DegT/DnrJ/EryC1/StrS family aminotransferase [bacterium]|nr:DegT/DnrJ/EryC1/StrS family aminotransferase [bacterium]